MRKLDIDWIDESFDLMKTIVAIVIKNLEERVEKNSHEKVQIPQLIDEVFRKSEYTEQEDAVKYGFALGLALLYVGRVVEAATDEEVRKSVLMM